MLHEWAFENKISKNAFENLLARLGVLFCPFHTTDGFTRESTLQDQVRIAEAHRGTRLFRNNSGVAYDKKGQPVRFGLANDSSQLNARVKSSDLIGIDDKGGFVSLEIKKPGWVYRGTDREKAQLNWITFINARGGRAKFVSSMADYEQQKNT